MIRTVITAFLLATALPNASLAASPSIQTKGPIIHLADNLDEKDKLGWCIDTVGRGQSDVLQTHSCKPSKAADLDVTFTYDAASGQIRSAAYDNQCATLNAEGAERRFGLVECKPGEEAQAFEYDVETGRLSPRGQEDQCLTAGAESITAGPYMSRTLDLVACQSVPKKLRTWIVRP